MITTIIILIFYDVIDVIVIITIITIIIVLWYLLSKSIINDNKIKIVDMIMITIFLFSTS